MSRKPQVLELGQGIATAYAGKLLAEHGANVVKLESLDSDAQHDLRAHVLDDAPDGTSIALNAKKTLRLAQAYDDLEGLLAAADIVVHDFDPVTADSFGIGPTTYDHHPGLIVVAITPFGSSGPHAQWRAEEITVANAGGWAALSPATKVDPALPPLKVFGQQCALLAGIVGAMTGLATLRDTRRSGLGEFVDVSQQDYVASVLEAALPNLSYMGVVSYRHHPRRLTPWRILNAQDAPIFLLCVEQDQWDRLVEFMGKPDWATVELFDDLEGRSENADLIHALLQEFVSEWKALDLYHAAQAHRVCFAPVFGFADLIDNEHLVGRDFIDTTPSRHGEIPLMASAALVNGERPSRRAAEHAPWTPRLASTDAPARLPLDGVRVVDFSWAWAGPFGSLLLAHLGADVIKLESADRLDIYRRYTINPPELPPGTGTSGMFNQYNQGKRSVQLNLSTSEGIDVAKDLIAGSDVVLQNFSTGVMARLGLDFETLKAVNPSIVLASISGYGQTGPWANYIGYGPAAAPLTGLSAVTGYEGTTEDELGLSMPDPTAGLTAAWQIVAALEERSRTSAAVHIDISLWEASAVLGLEGFMHYAVTGEQLSPNGNRDPRMAPHGCFRCSGEEAWVSIAVPDDAAWLRLVDVIDDAVLRGEDLRTLDARKAREDWIEERLTAWTQARDRWAVTQMLQDAGIPAYPSLSTADIVDSAHLNARGFIERLSHPVVGRRAHAGIPWRFSERTNGVRAPAPLFGADTDDVLANVLGYSATKIEALRESGAVR